MRPRASPSAPCQTPQSLLHKSCIYPSTQSTVFKPLIHSAIVARRGNHSSTWLRMCFFEQTTKYEPLGEKTQSKDAKEASSTSLSWRGKWSSRPLVKSGLESQKPRSHSPLTNTHQWACPLRAEIADNQSVVKHGAVTGQRSLPSVPQRAHARALIHLLSGLSSQWTHCVKPQGWY